jgi:hypothetical protein
MAEPGMQPGPLLEALLELADRAELEVRVLSMSGSGAEFRPTGSAACRVGSRIWVVLVPDDPPVHQASVLAEALGRFRAEFLEGIFIAPGVRNFIESVGGKAESVDRQGR